MSPIRKQFGAPAAPGSPLPTPSAMPAAPQLPQRAGGPAMDVLKRKIGGIQPR